MRADEHLAQRASGNSILDAAHEPPPFLFVEDLRVAYSKAEPILRSVNLSVRKGELLSILGPSGCGKTTLLKAIAGFVDSSGGRVLMEGLDLLQVPPSRRNIGFVFQNYALFPHMSILDNVAYGLASRRWSRTRRRERASEMLALVGMADLAARRPAQLSGGQQQRVAVARALAIEPILLLMDEPLSNLDAKLRVEMREEVRNLQRKIGITTLFVTHDQEEALTMSDRILLLSNGDVEQIGSPREVYESPKTRFVADFLGGGNIFVGRVKTHGEQNILDCGDIAFPVRLREHERRSSNLCAVIRHESVDVARQKTNDNAKPGVIEQAAFLGASWRYRIQLTGGRIVHASARPSSDGFETLGEESNVYVSWNIDDVTVVRDVS